MPNGAYIPVFERDYIELTRCFPVQETGTDSNGNPTLEVTYEQCSPFYVNKNDILCVNRMFDPLNGDYVGNKSEIYIKDVVAPIVVAQSYTYLKNMLNTIDNTDLMQDGCACL
jgi:hypothetical protein